MTKPMPSILDMINPYNAGKTLRYTVENAIDLAAAMTNSPASRLSPDRRSIYYYDYHLDDRLGLGDGVGGGGRVGPPELRDDQFDTSSTSSSSRWTRIAQSSSHASSLDEDYRPEVLVVGASGSLGRVLVKRLVLENKVRVRVLVRDLYSSTLNKLGTGVTYCQGDLEDVESLEYAVTDVDKIVFCAAGGGGGGGRRRIPMGEDENDRPGDVLDTRTRNARTIDSVGLRNLLHAYANVRHADYGTSQSSKRVLFKFDKRPADIDLFGIDDGYVDDNDVDAGGGDECDERPGTYLAPPVVSSQCVWRRNKFGHGIFVGKVRRDGVSAIASARLKSRGDPSRGIDLRSGGFAGLVCRVCGDGGVYEAFVRTEAYERLGVEYVREFKTSSRTHTTDGNDVGSMPRAKWITVRLAFADFRPRMRQFTSHGDEDAQRMRRALGKSDIPPFAGRDIRQLGFRYRGKSNGGNHGGAASATGWGKFYLALDYIKVYRSQPEPEFVYLSDARIPPVVSDSMVKHDLHRLVPSQVGSSASNSIIIDEEMVNISSSDDTARTLSETYFKYMGEEMIKLSGLR
jgi:hypothetical protein